MDGGPSCAGPEFDTHRSLTCVDTMLYIHPVHARRFRLLSVHTALVFRTQLPISSLIPLDLLLQPPQPLHNLPPYKLRQPQHTLARNNPITPTILPTSLYNLSPRVHLQTPKNIFRPRNPPKIRRIPHVAHVNPSACVPSPGAALVRGAPRAVVGAR